MFNNIDWFDFIVGGIIIGFIVNVASSFAHPRIAKWWGKYNITRRIKNKAQKQAFDEKVENLINNNHEELVSRIEVNRLSSFVIFMVLVGLTPMIVYQPDTMKTFSSAANTCYTQSSDNQN